MHKHTDIHTHTNTHTHTHTRTHTYAHIHIHTHTHTHTHLYTHTHAHTTKLPLTATRKVDNAEVSEPIVEITHFGADSDANNANDPYDHLAITFHDPTAY